MIWLLLAVPVHSLSAESRDDGRVFGIGTTAGCALVLATMLVLLVFLSRKVQLLSALCEFVGFLQFVRWLPLMRYSYSAFYEEFWIQASYLFDAYDYFGIYTAPPDAPQLVRMGIKTTLFFGNAEEQLFTLFVGAGVFIVLTYWLKSEFQLSVLSALYLATYTDVLLYVFVQFTGFSSETTLSLVSSICGLIIGILYIALTLIIVSAMAKFDVGDELYRIFTHEFKNSRNIYLFYYPLFLVCRLLSAAVLVFSESESVQFALLLVFEAGLLTYLVLLRPFKAFRHFFLVVVTRLFELMLLCVPVVSEADVVDEDILILVMMSFYWIGIAATITRFVLDCISTGRTRVQAIPKQSATALAQEKTVRPSMDETILMGSVDKPKKVKNPTATVDQTIEGPKNIVEEVKEPPVESPKPVKGFFDKFQDDSDQEEPEPQKKEDPKKPEESKAQEAADKVEGTIAFGSAGESADSNLAVTGPKTVKLSGLKRGNNVFARFANKK